MHVEQTRGGMREAVHGVSAVALSLPTEDDEPCVHLDADGSHRTFWRSSAKPFQLLAMLEALEAAHHSENTPFTVRSLSDEDLAMGASSHSGDAGHLARVRALLARSGHDPSDLQCGPARPLDPTERTRLDRTGDAPSPLHNDCSGKHAFMLLACAARGWSIDDYLAPAHPVQRAVASVLDRVAGPDHPVAIDGCGVPTFWMTVRQMATAFAHLARAMDDPDLDPMLARIGHAMSEHPELTSGQGRLDLAVARRASGPLVGKIGALGVFCIAWPQTRTGIAIKVHSGNEDALAVAIPTIVDTVCPGALRTAPNWPWQSVHNAAGTLVGRRHLVGLSPPLS